MQQAGAILWNPPNPRTFVIGVFQARLVVNSTTELALSNFTGGSIEVNGAYLDVSTVEIVCNVADNLIDNTGADAGSAPAVSTLYYAYCSSPNASTFPSDLRLSATAPSNVNGYPYLGGSGNALNWRYCGLVYVSAAGTFLDSVIARHVANYYNRRLRELYVCPGYVDDNAQTTYTASNLSFALVHAAAIVTFVTLGESAETFGFAARISSGPAVVSGLGLSFDSTTTPTIASSVPSSAVNENMSGQISTTLSRGFHTVRLLQAQNGAGTTTIAADWQRLGASADPAVTYIYGGVFG